MPNIDPSNEEYLAVVSEWSSYAQQSTSRVGNAYPIFCITRDCLVENPSDDFPNPGYVFLVNRGELNAWDFVRLRPVQNNRYKHANPRECFFITRMAPVVLEAPAADCHCAVLLDVPSFDPINSGTQIRNPKQSVTPIFFVRNAQQKVFGPLRRVQVSRSGDVSLDSIQWAAHGKDGIFYEFTSEDLKKQGCKLATYQHPEPDLNAVVHHPIDLVIGPVLTVTSERVHDRMPPGQLAEWYLRWRDLPEVPEPLLKTLRSAPEYLDGTRSDVIRRRCLYLSSLFPVLEVLQTERRNLVHRYLESEDGQKIVAEQMAVEIERRAETIEAEVLKRRSGLAEEEKRLAARWEEMQAGQRDKEQALGEELRQLESRRAALEEALASLQTLLRSGIENLGAQVRDNLPLLAALTVAQPATPRAGDERPVLLASPKTDDRSRWAEVSIPQPTKELADIEDESALVAELSAELTAEHLYFSRDFLANLYVTLKSSALNLIMGPPGHGKSSVVGGLARALGHGNALLEIAVRRTWSDDRYLLGFYDTFHGRYDPGPTGLATRLVQAQKDWERDQHGLYLVLLDEFNLAAPEYYFSQLLQLLTRPPEQRLLRLFDAAALPNADTLHQVRLYRNVSFWGTINYDETTERLSPRLLDRTGMIFLTARDVLPSFSGAAPASPLARKGVKAGQIVSFARRADQCGEAHWELIEPLLNLLKQQTDAWGAGVELSPRLVDSIKRYLANSDGLLPTARAVDFVFQQRVLPVLSGRGPRFAARVAALADKLSELGLDRSTRHVRDAMALAEAHFGDIDFLAY